MSDVWKDFERYYNNELKKIANRCKEILEDSIVSEVYDKYDPHIYDRTYQLRDNVEVDIKNNNIYVYVNTGNMHYTSAVTGKDVTAFVPMFVNDGHNRDVGGIFMYDNYPTRDYIRVAKERMQKEFGFEIEIVELE